MASKKKTAKKPKARPRKTKNTGKPYEQLTRDVFAKLESLVKLGAQVTHDVKVKGISLIHQIDVLIEYALDGIPCKAIIQCKDWNAKVKQEQVLAFLSVLQDIPGQPRGVVVSKKGFQKGAQKLAKDHGIVLYELREHTDTDWEGLLKGVEIEGVIFAPHFDNVRLMSDDEWLRNELVKRSIEPVPVSGTDAGRQDMTDLKMTFESGEPFDVNKLLNSYVSMEARDTFHIRHEFGADCVMVETPGRAVPFVRMLAVEADITVTEIRQTIAIRYDHMVAYCFRDVLGGTHQFLSQDGGQPAAGLSLPPRLVPT